MALTKAELGARIRAARESARLSQEMVAQFLGVSRATVSQIEAGRRAVDSLELSRLAKFFGRDISYFLAEGPAEQEVSVSVFLRTSELLNETDIHSVNHWLAICREYNNLERLLRLNTGVSSLVKYLYPDPQSPWDAIHVGEEVAEEERKRLDLGIAPLSMTKDLLELMEVQGVKVRLHPLPEKIDAICLMNGDAGPFILINSWQSERRLRFTLCHEYCHVLIDREKQRLISIRDSKDLVEVRANAFAAAFLMPDKGVQAFLRSLGKEGGKSRSTLGVTAGQATARGEQRFSAAAQSLQLEDIVLLQHHFGASVEATLWRLQNLEILSPQERERSAEQAKEAHAIAQALKLHGMKGPEQQEKVALLESFTRRFVHMALEAYRQDLITLAKLYELAEMVHRREEVEALVEELGILAEKEKTDDEDIFYPE